MKEFNGHHKILDKPNKMPKEMKEKWIEALRSGKYKQGRYYLNNNNSYCCLGVLQMCVDGTVERTDLGDSLSLPTVEWTTKHGIAFNGMHLHLHLNPYNEKMNSSYPVFKVPINRLLANFPSDSQNTMNREAFCLNDNDGFTFELIADLIEDQIEGF